MDTRQFQRLRDIKQLGESETLSLMDLSVYIDICLSTLILIHTVLYIISMTI